MNVSNLRMRSALLMDFMDKNDYSFSHKGWLKRCINLVLTYGASSKVKSYEQLYNQEVKRRGYESDAPVCLKLKSILGCIKQFDLDGIYPERRKPKGFISIPKKVNLLNVEFKSLIDHYERTAEKGTKTKLTIYAESRAAIQFFLHLQASGIQSITDIQERVVISFFYDGEKIIRAKDYKDKILPVLYIAKSLCGNEIINRLLTYFPALKKRHKNYPYLTREEAIRFLKVLSEEGSNIKLLDKALATLAYYTGLRGTDITSLTLENIDWEKSLIHLTQSKTHEELILPFNIAVGNAIWAYLSKERPNSKEKNIFVSSDKPYKKINNLWWHLKRVFDEVGIRTDGGRTGVRIFRHYLATSLLSEEVPAPIISSILGHTAPRSINPYIDADLMHLKECSLSVAEYPIAKEVLEL